MVLPLLVLIGGTLTAWAGVAFLVGQPARAAATLGVVITLPPAVMTLLTVLTVSRRWPDAGPTAVLAGTGLRMGVAVVVVAVLLGRVAEFGTTADALTRWTTGFYLLTLVLETGLLCRLLSRPATAGATGKPTDDPPAP